MAVNWRTLIYLSMRGALSQEERRILTLADRKYNDIAAGLNPALCRDMKQIVCKYMRHQRRDTDTLIGQGLQVSDDELLQIF